MSTPFALSLAKGNGAFINTRYEGFQQKRLRGRLMVIRTAGATGIRNKNARRSFDNAIMI
jgi:hypothetical protein